MGRKGQQHQGINDVSSLGEAFGVSVQSFGAVGDGATDDTAAIERAIVRARELGKPLFFPNRVSGTGHYVATSELDMGGLDVRGTDGAILDFTGAPAANFPTLGCVLANGSFEALPDLAGDVSRGAQSIQLTSAPTNLSAGQWFFIYDPTDGSFNPARSVYRAGEFCYAAQLSGDTITLDRPLRANYAAATVDLYVMSPSSLRISNLEIRGLGATTNVAVIRADLCADLLFKNLVLSGSEFTHLRMMRSVSIYVSNVAAFDDAAPGATNYGISLDSCQDAVITACKEIVVPRHAITLNTFDAVGGVPNRDIVVSDCILRSLAHTAIDAHGASEDYTFIDCFLYGGATLGGDRANLLNCLCTGNSVGSGRAVILSETIGVDFTVKDCTLREVYPLASSRALMDWGGNSDAEVLASRAGSGFIIENNRFELNAGLLAMDLHTRSTETNDINATIRGNKVYRNTTTNVSALFGIFGDLIASSYWRKIICEGNELDGVGLYMTNTAAEDVQIRGNQVRNAPRGIWYDDGPVVDAFPWGDANGAQSIIVDSAQARECYGPGISVTGYDQTVSQGKIVNSSSVNNGQDTGLSSSFRTSVFVDTFNTMQLRGNTFGDSQAVATQTRSYAAQNVTLLVEGDNDNVGPLLSVNFTSIGRKVSRIYQTVGGGNGWNVEASGTVGDPTFPAPPTSGDWIVGDRMWNATPTVGQPIGWMCTANGTPGTWVALANL